MGKSPGKWIKTVFLGKKSSSKSNLSKDATSEIKVSITGKTPSDNFGADSMIISSPVRPVIDSNDHTELENSSSANLITDTPENPTTPIDLTAMTAEDLIKLEQAATKAQAACRVYLARRAFWALKGIIRLQALVRGFLVRRRVVATLKQMRKFQALVRGQKVRLSGSGPPRQLLNKKPSELLQKSIREEKLSTNKFATKDIFTVGEEVEVNGFDGDEELCFYVGTIIRLYRMTANVRFRDLKDRDGKPLVRAIRMEVLRPKPPVFVYEYMSGDAVEVWEDNRWSKGRIFYFSRRPKVYCKIYRSENEVWEDDVFCLRCNVRPSQDWHVKDGVAVWKHRRLFDAYPDTLLDGMDKPKIMRVYSRRPKVMEGKKGAGAISESG